MLDHSMKKRGNICVSGIGLVVHHTISFFGDQPEGIIETAVTNDWNVIETFKEYYEDFSYGKLGKIDFDE